MARVRVIHWKTAEAEPLLAAMRKAGVTPEFDDCSNTPELGRRIRLNPPDAIVIDLSRLPSQGRAVAHWLRSSKALRAVPIVFANGAEDKIAKVREIMPDAVCVSNSVPRDCRSPHRPRVMASDCGKGSPTFVVSYVKSSRCVRCFRDCGPGSQQFDAIKRRRVPAHV